MWAPSAGAGRRDLLLILFLAAAPLLAYAPAWLEGRLLAPGDGAALHLPLRAEVWRAWDRGEVPSWNGSAFSGTPLLASYRPGALHPLMVALTPLAPFAAFQLLVLASLALVGPLTFLYARRLGAGRVGALVAGLGFALGPYLVAHLGDTARSWRPPPRCRSCFSPRKLTSPRAGPRPPPPSPLAVALLLLAGSKEAVGAGALLLGARLLLAPPGARARERARGALSTAAAVLAGVLLAAPQLVPTLVALREAGPGGTGVAGHAGVGPRAAWPGSSCATSPTRRPPSSRWPPCRSWRACPPLRPAAAVVGLVPPPLRRARGARGRGGPAARLRLRARPPRRALPLRPVARPARASRPPPATARPHRRPVRRGVPVGRHHRDRPARAGARGARRAPRARPHPLLRSRREARRGGGPRLPAAVLASFLLQPWGRDAWAGAPTVAELEQATPTREALDHAMGERRARANAHARHLVASRAGARPRLGEPREPHRAPQRQRLRPHGARLAPRRARRHGLGRHRSPPPPRDRPGTARAARREVGPGPDRGARGAGGRGRPRRGARRRAASRRGRTSSLSPSRAPPRCAW